MVSQCLEELSALPPISHAEYVEKYRDRDSGNPAADAIARLQAVYPSPLRMLVGQMRWRAPRRPWGLIAVVECYPRNTLQPQYAPPLKPMMGWLQDADPIVASNALAVLQTYVVLPPDYFAPGGIAHGQSLREPADWHAVYRHWLREENPAWSQVHTHYYCRRNWPPPIQ